MADVTRPETVLVYSGLELMGDGIIKLAFLRTLRAAFPHSRITWLAGKGRTVYAHELHPLVLGLIDEVIEEAGVGLGARELVMGRPLAQRRFDLVIDTQSRVMTTLIVRRIRHRLFVSPAARFRLSDRRPERYAKPSHLNDRLTQLIELATGASAPSPVAVRIPEALAQAAERLLPPGRPYVGFLPGAGDRAKCWPLERFIALAGSEQAKGRHPVFILGPAEEDWQAPLESAVQGALFPYRDAARLAIETGPLLTIALGRRLAVAVANDSGGGHLIAEGGAPLVSLFGPTDPAKFHPVAERLAIVTAQQFGGEAMDLIPVDAVARALDALLGEQKS